MFTEISVASEIFHRRQFGTFLQCVSVKMHKQIQCVQSVHSSVVYNLFTHYKVPGPGSNPTDGFYENERWFLKEAFVL